MGQKCNSNSLRIGLNKNWLSRWISKDRKTTIKLILEDEKVRNFIESYCSKATVGLIEIERFINLQNQLTFSLFVHVAQPGILINNEKEIEYIEKEVKKVVGKDMKINLQIIELKNPGVSANVLANDIKQALENRLPFRSSIKRIIKKAMHSGAKGIKIKVSGRINGVEMARSESYSEGSIPLSTLRADIEYSFRIAKTDYGVLGVKVWVNRGLYFGKYFMPMPESVNRWNKNEKNRVISNNY